jgi:hypothetical protein
MSLLAFNVGIEVGQLLVPLLLLPTLNLAFRVVPERPGAIVLAVVVGHTAWHWLDEPFAVLRSFDVVEIGHGLARSELPWLLAGLAGIVVAWRLAHRAREIRK